MINILLVIILIILLIKFTDIINIFKRNEKFDVKYVDEAISNLPQKKNTVNDVVPDGSVVPMDNIMSYELYSKNAEDAECDRIDNYRHKFFEFNDRINQTTHLGDPVDAINITNKAQDYNIGASIADIYDDLVGNPYKDTRNSQCKIITPDR